MGSEKEERTERKGPGTEGKTEMPEKLQSTKEELGHRSRREGGRQGTEGRAPRAGVLLVADGDQSLNLTQMFQQQSWLSPGTRC